MLKKLLKYDLKNMYKFLIIFYIITISSAIIFRFFNSLEQTTIMIFIKGFTQGFMFAMIANTLINTMIRLWIRFKETLYSDESYLTHTLPVSKKDIYNSKFILSILTLFTSLVTVLIAILIAYYTKDKFIAFKEIIKGIAASYNINGIIIVTGLALIFFLEILSGLQSGYLGIIFGNKQNNNKTVMSIIYGFVVYFITQLFSLLLLLVCGLFNSNLLNIFTGTTVAEGIIKSIFIISTICYILVIIINKSVIQKQLNKGVNVD